MIDLEHHLLKKPLKIKKLRVFPLDGKGCLKHGENVEPTIINHLKADCQDGSHKIFLFQQVFLQGEGPNIENFKVIRHN
ncbi:MAG: hypothetical protein A2V86_00950 [Deltaproteobacteria bacterium RBG_16_49_23]|nr:MAG: hypothetical protein A2V86_00950 [Deltaproteobacteria bacterium RBG_16_49_23]